MSTTNRARQRVCRFAHDRAGHAQYVRHHPVDRLLVHRVDGSDRHLCRNSHRQVASGHKGATVTSIAAILFITGASFDAIENLISFAMLAAPSDFSDALAYPYSTAAAIKFLAIGPAILFLFGSAIMAAARTARSAISNDRALAL